MTTIIIKNQPFATPPAERDFTRSRDPFPNVVRVVTVVAVSIINDIPRPRVGVYRRKPVFCSTPAHQSIATTPLDTQQIVRRAFTFTPLYPQSKIMILFI